MQTDVTALPIGTRLEKYELQKVLGQGGGGITYLAFDFQLEREVVLKEHFPLGLCRRVSGSAQVEPVEPMLYERSFQNFCREARILAALRHVGIVSIHEIFAACGTAFLVTDYVEGATLREWMCHKPSGKRITAILIKLLKALEYIHANGVLHRDIKPDNILVKEGDEPIFIDFGSALVGEPTHTLTQVGTPAYAAPEQLTALATPGPQADIYALARTFNLLAAECGMRLPRRVTTSLQKAGDIRVEKRYISAVDWLKKLQFRPYRWVIAGVSIALCAAVVPWWRNDDIPVQAQKMGTASKQSVIIAPKIRYEHPIELIEVDNSFKLVAGFIKNPRYEREIKFQQDVLALQKALNDKKEALMREKVDTGMWPKSQYYREIIPLERELNNKFAQLIQEYINTCLDGADPQPTRTQSVINILKKSKMKFLAKMMHMYTIQEKREKRHPLLRVFDFGMN